MATPEEAWTNMQNRIAQLEQQILLLTQQPPPPTPTPVQHSDHRNSVKYNKPPEYDGKDKHFCSTFLSHIELYIQANNFQFTTDQSKILFTISYLRGSAYNWIEPHIGKEENPIMNNWPQFKSAMIKNLGDPDKVRTATRQLRTLQQTKSCAAYSTEFFKLSAFLSWNDDALISQFHNGLKPEVKYALAIMDRDFKTVEELSETAVRLDNRIFEQRSEENKSKEREKSASNARNSSNNAPVASHTPRDTSSDPIPMNIDATSGRKFQPLTQEEKDRRRKNNLCLYCGQSGHILNNCPIKKPRTINSIDNSDSSTPSATFTLSKNSADQA
jgi:hypothetical protein